MYRDEKTDRSYRTPSYFDLERHEERCSWKSVAKRRPAIALSPTSYMVRNVHGVPTKIEEMGDRGACVWMGLQCCLSLSSEVLEGVEYCIHLMEI